VERFEAAVDPDAKLARVSGWRDRGTSVLVAGDGINDAAALAAGRRRRRDGARLLRWRPRS
jgi:cation transport ATPase